MSRAILILKISCNVRYKTSNKFFLSKLHAFYHTQMKFCLLTIFFGLSLLKHLFGFILYFWKDLIRAEAVIWILFFFNFGDF